VKNLIGMYECRADAKGRLMLPSGLKKQLAAELQEGFVLKRSVFNACLELYPLAEWNFVMADVNKLNRFVKKNNDFVRMFTAGVRMVDADSTARIQIPKDLINFAGIQKQIVLASVGNIVEIWDKDQYEKTVNDASVDFGLLAEEVMGNTEKTE
jgi:MraZ protein